MEIAVLKNFIFRLLVFLFINFGALYLGNILQGGGPFAQWYKDLEIAPWTPPGWVFGAAWTTIMLLFSVYLARLLEKTDWKMLAPLFAIQFVLNVSWNPVFFRFHLVVPALIILVLLLAVVAWIGWRFRKDAQWFSLLIVPYVLWLCVAASLNGYVWIAN